MFIVPSALFMPKGSKIRASSGLARSGHRDGIPDPSLHFYLESS